MYVFKHFYVYLRCLMNEFIKSSRTDYFFDRSRVIKKVVSFCCFSKEYYYSSSCIVLRVSDALDCLLNSQEEKDPNQPATMILDSVWSSILSRASCPFWRTLQLAS